MPAGTLGTQLGDFPMTSPDSLTVGSTFHGWKLERILARGGSGTVFAAKHQLPFGQPVMSARLLRDGEQIDLGGGEMLRIEQPSS